MIRRYDQSEPISSVTTTPSGGRRLAANLSRVGVFSYTYGDGTKVREYRPPEEVLHPESVASFRGAPVTDLHPPDMVTPENFRQFSKGHAQAVDAKPPYVVGALDVNDADLIKLIDSGDRKEVSCGYTADFDATPGVTPDGEPYDGVQRNIRGNHVAIGPEGWGRQGPTVALRLDSISAIASCMTVATATPMREEKKTMAKIKLDGIDVEQGSDVHLSLLEKLHGEATKRADAAESTVKSEKARADEAEKIAAAEKLRADTAEALISPQAIAARVAERVRLVTIARKACGPRYLADAAEMAAASDDDIIVAALTKMSPAFSAKGMSHDQLMGALAYACAGAASEETAEMDAQTAGGQPLTDPLTDPTVSPDLTDDPALLGPPSWDSAYSTGYSQGLNVAGAEDVDPEFKGGTIAGVGTATPAQKGPMGFDSKTAPRGRIGQRVANPNIPHEDGEVRTQAQVLRDRQRKDSEAWKSPVPGALTKEQFTTPVRGNSKH